MAKTLLTGGTGFVGANLARCLLHEGHDVSLIVRANSDAWRIMDIRPECKVHICDLSDAEETNRVVAQARPEWVFHLAAHGAYSWQTNLDAMLQSNLHGTVNILNASIRYGCESFINAGSSSEYGLKASAPSETDLIEPNSYYAITKASGTHICNYTAQHTDANVRTLRLYSVYGPYENPGRFIPTLVRCALSGELPPLVNPNIARDFVYVGDVCKAFLLAAVSGSKGTSRVYNVGSGRQTTIREAVNIAREIFGIPVEPVWGSMRDRHWDAETWVADITRIKHELGWAPKVMLKDGLREMMQWTQSNCSHCSRSL